MVVRIDKGTRVLPDSAASHIRDMDSDFPHGTPEAADDAFDAPFSSYQYKAFVQLRMLLPGRCGPERDA